MDPMVSSFADFEELCKISKSLYGCIQVPERRQTLPHFEKTCHLQCRLQN